MLGYDVIGPNEPPLTGTGGFCADGEHHAAEQDTQRDAAVCAEPGSHIILSTPGAKQQRRHGSRGAGYGYWR